MNKKLVITAFLLALLVIISGWVIFNRRNYSLSSPQTDGQLQLQGIAPVPVSKTVKDYEDPSGFNFSYPDNLSLVKNEAKTDRVYADIKLSLKDIDGSINIYISDSNFKTLDDWVKANKTASQTTKETKLGSLEAVELAGDNKVLLAALDQGVLFTIEQNLKNDFWMEIYSKILETFNFTSPAVNASESASSDEVVFEGEEVVN